MKIPVGSFDEGEAFDPEIIAIEKQGAMKALDLVEDAGHVLKAYMENQLGGSLTIRERSVMMAVDAFFLMIGKNLVAGVNSPSELAKKHSFTKQRVGKCLNQFLDRMQIEPLWTQRDKEAKTAMSVARKEQVGKR